MINLLPKKITKQIKAGHNNVFLIKNIIIVSAAAVFLGLGSIGTYIFLISIEDSAKNTSSISVVAKNLEEAETEANNISSVLSDARNILNQQTSYSNILIELASKLPEDMIINELNISENENSQTTLKIYAKNTENINLLTTNFANSSVFTGFSISSTLENQTNLAGYPVEISVNTNISKGSAK